MPARRTRDSVRGRVLAASHDQTGTVAHLARVKYPALGEGSLSCPSVLSLEFPATTAMREVVIGLDEIPRSDCRSRRFEAVLVAIISWTRSRGASIVMRWRMSAISAPFRSALLRRLRVRE